MSDPNFVPNQLGAKALQDLILSGFSAGSEVHVQDVTGDGYHFEVVVISDDFKGLNTLKQHQKVYDLVGEQFKDKLHAMTLKTSVVI